MKELSKNEWVAIVIAVFVVGFFFVFGQMIIDIINPSAKSKVMQQSELQIQDELVGTGEVAVTGKRVTVHYTGRFLDGNIFDSSVNRGEPFQFILGTGQVIKGWDQGVAGMKVGGKRILIVPPELGYGPNDYGPIPGGSILIFDVELLKVD